MANWSTATLLERLLELVEAHTELDAQSIVADPTLLDSTWPKASDLVEFLKDRIITEAMAGRANVTRPTKKAKKPATPKAPKLPKADSEGDDFGVVDL